MFNTMVFDNLPVSYREYRTIAAHQAGETVLVVEQEAVGTSTAAGVASRS